MLNITLIDIRERERKREHLIEKYGLGILINKSFRNGIYIVRYIENDSKRGVKKNEYNMNEYNKLTHYILGIQRRGID